MVDTRKPIIRPDQIPATPRTVYNPAEEAGRFSRGSSGTIVGEGASPNRGRQTFNVPKPAVVVFHASRNGGSMPDFRYGLQGYYSPKLSDGPFTDPGLPVLPLIGGRFAWLFAPGQWDIDVALGGLATTAVIDYDIFYVDNEQVARSIIGWANDEDQPSQNTFHQVTVVAALVPTTLISMASLMLLRAVSIQNVGANPVFITMDGVIPDGARGYRIAAGAERVFKGVEMCYTAFGAFSTIGTTLNVNGPEFGWRLY